jgi:hypothetical protein
LRLDAPVAVVGQLGLPGDAIDANRPRWLARSRTRGGGLAVGEWRSPGRTYDVSPDGKRFLMIKEAASTNTTSPPPELIVVQHWFEELKRLVPTN